MDSLPGPALCNIIPSGMWLLCSATVTTADEQWPCVSSLFRTNLRCSGMQDH